MLCCCNVDKNTGSTCTIGRDMLRIFFLIIKQFCLFNVKIIMFNVDCLINLSNFEVKVVHLEKL